MPKNKIIFICTLLTIPINTYTSNISEYLQNQTHALWMDNIDDSELDLDDLPLIELGGSQILSWSSSEKKSYNKHVHFQDQPKRKESYRIFRSQCLSHACIYRYKPLRLQKYMPLNHDIMTFMALYAVEQEKLKQKKSSMIDTEDKK